jgi:pyruvate-formate lyase-activating enzyme
MGTRIGNLSIVVGTKACNAKCPFCVSRMTGFDEVVHVGSEINELNLHKACRFAQIHQTDTVLLTGKGEPTLYPDEISRYLGLLAHWDFPFIEMQTNAIEFGRLARGERSKIKGLDAQLLRTWRSVGLNTIAISNVGHVHEWNREVYGEIYGDLAPTIAFLRGMGFTIRLCTMMLDGFIDSPARIEELLAFCKQHGVAQLTVRPIRKPTATHDGEASDYVATRGVSAEQEATVVQHVKERATLLRTLMHNTKVFDMNGQNICLSDCLTVGGTDEDIRTLIFYSDGTLSYDWQYDGAVLLEGTRTQPKNVIPVADLVRK